MATLEQTQAVLNRNGAAFASGDLEAILTNYAEDAVMVRPGRIYRGHEELRQMFAEVFANMEGLTSSITSVTVAEGIALMTWTATSAGGRIRQGVDNYVIADDRIVAQSYCGGL
ncbi:MAG: nuclear transport factor 2 family protein [Cyanobacteriota bacterium]